MSVNIDEAAFQLGRVVVPLSKARSAIEVARVEVEERTCATTRLRTMSPTMSFLTPMAFAIGQVVPFTASGEDTHGENSQSGKEAESSTL